jgi:hypothetical protein
MEVATGQRPRASIWRDLPFAIAATVWTIGLPPLLAYLLASSYGGLSIAAAVVFSMALSVLFATIGAWVWQRTPHSGAILFGDLLLVGFIRRLRAERRIAGVVTLLDADRPHERSAQLQARVLERLARALEARDPYMAGHSRRVARGAELVARQMGLPADEVRRVRVASAVHDAGKVDTPVSILNKARPLTDEEFDVIKRHTIRGEELVRPLGDPDIAAIIRHHHERLDGSGYPDGLRGKEIPLGARIVAVVDTFDAITSSRPYRRARSQRTALRIMRDEAGTRLDAEVVTAFLHCYSGRGMAAWSSLFVALPERLAGAMTGGVAPLAAGSAAIAGLGGAVVDMRHREATPAEHVSRSAPLNAMEVPSLAEGRPLRVVIPRTRHHSRTAPARDRGVPQSPSRQGVASPAPGPAAATEPDDASRSGGAHGKSPTGPVPIPPVTKLIPSTPVAVPGLEPPAAPELPRIPALPTLP